MDAVPLEATVISLDRAHILRFELGNYRDRPSPSVENETCEQKKRDEAKHRKCIARGSHAPKLLRLTHELPGLLVRILRRVNMAPIAFTPGTLRPGTEPSQPSPHGQSHSVLLHRDLFRAAWFA